MPHWCEATWSRGDHDLHRRVLGEAGRNWRIFSGLLGVIAGIIVLTYPISSAVTLAFIAGIWLVTLGAMQVFAGFQLRRVRTAGRSAAGPRDLTPRAPVLSCRAAPSRRP